MVVRDHREAPGVAVDFVGRGVECRRGVALKVRERTVEGDLCVFEDLAEGAVAHPVGGGEVLVVADARRALLDDLVHGRVGEDETGASVAEFDVVDVKVLADVVRLARVEVGEVLQEVVPAQEGVGFDEDEPLRGGHLLVGAVDHGQELPLVELPAVVPGIQIVALAGAGLGHDDVLAVDIFSPVLLQLMVQLEIIVLVPPLLGDASQDIVHRVAFDLLVQVG